jgi:hypothetical protein
MKVEQPESPTPRAQIAFEAKNAEQDTEGSTVEDSDSRADSPILYDSGNADQEWNTSTNTSLPESHAIDFLLQVPQSSSLESTSASNTSFADRNQFHTSEVLGEPILQKTDVIKQQTLPTEQDRTVEKDSGNDVSQISHNLMKCPDTVRSDPKAGLDRNNESPKYTTIRGESAERGVSFV